MPSKRNKDKRSLGGYYHCHKWSLYVSSLHAAMMEQCERDGITVKDFIERAMRDRLEKYGRDKGQKGR